MGARLNTRKEHQATQEPWEVSLHGVGVGGSSLGYLCLTPFALEKAMATHSSTLAWKIPRMEEPGRLQSMGLQSWTQLSDFTFT